MTSVDVILEAVIRLCPFGSGLISHEKRVEADQEPVGLQDLLVRIAEESALV